MFFKRILIIIIVGWLPMVALAETHPPVEYHMTTASLDHVLRLSLTPKEYQKAEKPFIVKIINGDGKPQPYRFPSMGSLGQIIQDCLDHHAYLLAHELLVACLDQGPVKNKETRVKIDNYFYDHLANMVKAGEDRKLNNEAAAQFYFFYGEVALRTGHFAAASDAFDTALIALNYDRSPLAVRIRFDYADAMLGQGRVEEARQEYLFVEQFHPPAPARLRIREMLDRISSMSPSRKSTISVTATTKVGYDSNVDTSTDADTISYYFPSGFIFNFPLGDDSRAKASPFADYNLSGVATTPFGSTGTFFAQGNLDRIKNFSAHEFDTDTLSLAAGADYLFGTDNRYEFVVPVQLQHTTLDSQSFVNAMIVVGELSRVMDIKNKVGIYGEHDLIYFTGDNTRTVSVNLAGVTWTHMMPGIKTWMVLKLYGGLQEPWDHVAANEQFGRKIVGLNLQAQWRGSSKFMPYADFVLQRVHYDAPETPFSLDARSETYIDGDLGLNYSLSKSLKLFGEFHYTKNRSNIDFNAYKRSLVEVGVNYTLDNS